MTKVTLDKTLRVQLPNLDTPLELCDESGRTVGFLLSVADYQRLIYEWAKAKYPAEELERRRQDPGERTTGEVLERLR